MYIPDLSPYTYQKIEGAIAVGWLSGEHVFHQGSVEPEVLAKLSALAVNKSTHRMRGIHRCEFCMAEEVFGDSDGVCRMLGAAEVWLPGLGVTYASPDLIVHYIGAHGYRPPQVYLDAVRALDYDTWGPNAYRGRSALLGRE